MYFRKKDEIRIQEVDLEREEPSDWFNPEKELTSEDWEKIMGAIQRGFVEPTKDPDVGYAGRSMHLLHQNY